jgi:hypothetical protein
MPAPKQSNMYSESPTARLVMKMCNETDKSQQQIAEESGFPKSNIITMLKSGRTKFPIRRIRDFSRATEGDASLLLDTYLEEYMPEVRDVILAVKGRSMSVSERDIIVALREAKKDHDVVQGERTFWNTGAKPLKDWAIASVKKLVK